MNYRISSGLAIATLLLLFGFPKAGFYIGEVPITIGYLMLALVAFLQATTIARQRYRSINRSYIILGVCLFVLGVIEVFAYRVYGFQSLGSMISILTSTLVMPLMTILATHWMLDKLGLEGLLRGLRWALVAVFVAGMAGFIGYNLFGQFVGIPYLTTTGADVSLVATRHNLRGPIIKMIGTYNNGNILGINLLMWGPLAALGAVSCAFNYRTLCVLTLSRSVWAGLIAIEFFKATVDRSIRRATRALLAGAMLVIAVIVVSLMIGKDPAQFLLDTNLGGRLANLEQDLEVISNRRIAWESESIYAASWLAFGPIGMLLLLFTWCIPIAAAGTTEVQKTARMVMIVYLLVASVEGAFTLIPTQATYWFVGAIAMYPANRLSQSQAIDQGPTQTNPNARNSVQPRRAA